MSKVSYLISPISCLFIILSSCTSKPAVKKQPEKFIDLKGYFENEIKRLSGSEKPVNKTVSRNNSTETRIVRDVNWANELSMFIESDINKLAWLSSYRVSKKNDSIIYTALSDDLRTRRLSIQKNQHGDIIHIAIINRTKNSLYQSNEQLVYYPDSLYRIVKRQHVRIIGANKYVITGKLK